MGSTNGRGLQNKRKVHDKKWIQSPPRPSDHAKYIHGSFHMEEIMEAFHPGEDKEFHVAGLW